MCPKFQPNILRAPKVSCFMLTLCTATQQLLEVHRQNDVDKKIGWTRAIFKRLHDRVEHV